MLPSSDCNTYLTQQGALHLHQQLQENPIHCSQQPTGWAKPSVWCTEESKASRWETESATPLAGNAQLPVPHQHHSQEGDLFHLADMGKVSVQGLKGPSPAVFHDSRCSGELWHEALLGGQQAHTCQG